MNGLARFFVTGSVLGCLLMSGCGADAGSVAVIAAAAGGGAAAAQGDTQDPSRTPVGDESDFNGIYHLSATSAQTALLACPASMTGWMEADGAKKKITRGFLLFMDCNTQRLERVEVDGDFFFDDVDKDVCSQLSCLRIDLNVGFPGGQTARIWRGFLVRGGEGIVFAQVDQFNRSALAGSGWRLPQSGEEAVVGDQ